MKNFEYGFWLGALTILVIVAVLFCAGAIKPWFSVEMKVIEKIQYVEVENELICKDEEKTEMKKEENENENEMRFLGNYKLTAYCACDKCCGKTDAITATGAKATQGRTIAVDPKVIPYGSEVIIDGEKYIAEDCGGAIKNNRIDVYFENHDDALNFGVKFEDVYLAV